jgi:EamA domain-containing membrane protein RarD
MDKDTLQSIAVNGATIGISLTNVEATIRITALVVGLVFTLYKFYLTYKNEKSSINKVK